MHLVYRFHRAEKAKVNRRVESTPPPAVVRLFAPAKTNSPVPLLAPVLRLLGAATEDEEVKFSKPMQRLEAPRAWPNKAIKCEGHGSVSRGDRCGSRRDQGRTGSNYTNRRAKTAIQSPIKLWPHMEARILP
jgi:hypothetical protein